jgi:hypothetical protein
MLIKLRGKSVHFVGQEERDANSNINWSVRAPETEESVVSIGIPLFAFLSERHRLEAARLALPSRRSPDWLKMKNPEAPAVKREPKRKALS